MAYSKNDIEEILDIDEIDSNILKQIDEGQQFPYVQCFGLLGCQSDVENVRQAYYDFADSHPILRSGYCKSPSGELKKFLLKSPEVSYTFHHFVDVEEDEINSTINQCFALNFKKSYDPERTFLSNLLIFHVDIDYYFVMLSYCTALSKYLNTKLLVKSVLGNRAIVSVSDRITEIKHSNSKCISYYRDTLGDLSKLKKVKKTSNNYFTEILPIDKDLRDLIEVYKKQSLVSLKAACTSIWGILLCKLFTQNNIIIGEEIMGKKLSVIPYKINAEENFDLVIENVKKQIESAEAYDNCRFSNLETAYDLDFSKIMPMTQCFSTKFLEDSRWKKMNKSLIYEMDAEETPSFAIDVTYRLMGNNPCISYKYNSSTFENISIYSLHDNFLKFLKGYLEKSIDPDISSTIIEQGKKINQSRRIQTIANFLNKQELFSTCTEEKILQLAKSANILHYSLDEPILPAGFTAKGLYIILNGRVIMEKANVDGVAHPLLVMKPGDIYGLESLAVNNMVKNSYKAITDDVLIVQFKAKDIRNLADRNPAVLAELFEIENKRMDKFQKLWLMAD